MNEPLDLAMAKLEATVMRLISDRRVLAEAVYLALAYFSDRADVYDGPDGQPMPNDEARIANSFTDALAHVRRP
jgi:hypothetical protein